VFVLGFFFYYWGGLVDACYYCSLVKLTVRLDKGVWESEWRRGVVGGKYFGGDGECHGGIFVPGEDVFADNAYTRPNLAILILAFVHPSYNLLNVSCTCRNLADDFILDAGARASASP
jgi:hypothetical protein